MVQFSINHINLSIPYIIHSSELELRASVIQSVYRTTISHSDMSTQISFTILDIFLVIQRATHHDFIL